MIYPKSINRGDRIEIISPSNGVKKKKMAKFENAISTLRDYGFDICEDKYVRCSFNGVSSSAYNRAQEFNSAVNNSSIKAMIACSGGDYIIQILKLIDFNNLVKNVKWIQGQSDITVLLYYITTKYDISTIYSFNAKSFGDNNLPISMIENNIKFLSGKIPKQIEYGYKIEDKNIEVNWKCITTFKPFRGRAIGGCLDSIKDIIGTKYDNTKNFLNKYKEDGIIWYFDVAEMTNEDILRTMWQFKEADWFENCKGIIFGRVENEVTYTNTLLEEAINYCLKDLNIPIIINADIGHTYPVFTVINGSIIQITKKDKFIMETFFK